MWTHHPSPSPAMPQRTERGQADGLARRPFQDGLACQPWSQQRCKVTQSLCRAGVVARRGLYLEATPAPGLEGLGAGRDLHRAGSSAVSLPVAFTGRAVVDNTLESAGSTIHKRLSRFAGLQKPKHALYEEPVHGQALLPILHVPVLAGEGLTDKACPLEQRAHPLLWEEQGKERGWGP